MAIRHGISFPSEATRASSTDGVTALHRAATATDIISLLISAGADVESLDSSGCRPGDLIPRILPHTLDKSLRALLKAASASPPSTPPKKEMAFRARMKELMKKYGKVAIGVHLSVSTVSITGLYVAIKNNIDVESIFERIGLSARVEPDKVESTDRTDTLGEDHPATPPSTTNRTAAMVASSGGALALAILCNKALFPVRVPITIALTPPIARYLVKRNLLKT